MHFVMQAISGADAGLGGAAIRVSAIIAYAAIPAITMIAGASIATVWLPGRRMRSLLQHFAAGVVFSVVAVDLLPNFLHAHDLVTVAIGFSAGVALMLLLRLTSGPPDATPDENEYRHHLTVTGLVVPVAVDAALDGALIGISFTAGTKQGALLSIALGLEMFSIGLALATTLRSAGTSAVRSAAVTVAIALLILAGAVAGVETLRGVSSVVLTGVFAFATAALLYLVTEELLVRAHAAAETTLATAMFFVGFLIFLLIGMAI